MMNHARPDAPCKRWTGFFLGAWSGRLGFSLLLAALLFSLALPGSAYAEEGMRSFPIYSTVEAEHWNLVRWDNNSVVCDLFVKPGQDRNWPSLTDIKNNCSKDVVQAWTSTGACAIAADGSPVGCKGLFLRYLGTQTATVKDFYEVPAASVRIEIANCRPWTWCSERPLLNFVGSEPLANYFITSVHARIGTQERSCAGSTCQLRLPVTDAPVQLEYWAVSSYGDESPHSFVTLRNRRPTGQPDQFYLEMLGEDWSGPAPAGVNEWGIFPNLTSTVTPLLAQPASSSEMATQRTYMLLAGYLIRSGLSDASGCPSGGVLANGNANTCGEERAHPQTLEWQNRYDSQILSAALTSKVPARLLKGIIARETQFWPISQSPYELGLGKITANGADLLLSWDVDHFLKLCMPLYGSDGCGAGYSSLSADQKTILRRQALGAVGTPAEIDLLAATLRASSLQVGQMMVNVTGQPVSSAAALEDMWLLSVANYHAGSGCVGGAMQAAATSKMPMTWEQISTRLEPACQPAIEYVRQVMELGQ